MNKKIPIRFLLLFFFATVIYSCGPRELSPNKYGLYVNNPKNGYISSVRKDGLELSAFYKPAEYIALTKNGKVGIDSIQFKSAVIEESGFMCFDLTMQTYGNLQPDNQSGLVNIVASSDAKTINSYGTSKYAMEDLFELNVNGMVMPCVFAHKEANGHVTGSSKLLLVFESISPDTLRNLTMKFNGELCGFFTHEFAFDVEKINSTPKIKL